MKILIIDGNSILNRAFYGIKHLSAPDGTPTNAVYGFIAICKKLLSDYAPDAMSIAFDLKAPTFRHKRYDGYKATRGPMPDELAIQVPIIKSIIDTMHINRIELEGYEADDLLGTVSALAEERGWQCIVATGDRDSLQLISDKTSVCLIRTGKGATEHALYDRERFIEEYGFEPIKLIDLKSLMGDSSDNIPGIKGIGEKTALQLVRDYGSMKFLLDNTESLKVSDSIKNKIISGKADAELSYYLATIVRNATIDFNFDDALYSNITTSGLYNYFLKLGFNKFIETWHLSPDSDDIINKTALPEIIYDNDATSSSLLEEVRNNSNPIAFVSDALSEKIELYVDGVIHILCRTECMFSYDSFLRDFLSSNIKKITHDLKKLLDDAGSMEIDMAGIVFDTAIAAYLSDPVIGDYSLKNLSGLYLHRQGEGAFEVQCLYESLKPLVEEYKLEHLLYDVELPLCKVLTSMEKTGFMIDRKALNEFGTFLSESIDRAEESIYTLVGHKFNINSPKQLGVVLFEELMLPYGKKTKTGWSTNAEILQKLSGKHPVIDEILSYRSLSKLKSTYTDGLSKVIKDDGRLHTHFQMMSTATGRLSSTEPNLQNIPVRTQMGAELRKMFIAPEGYILIDADYSQIELRILADMSGDENMISAFKNEMDFHTATASTIFGVPVDKVDSRMRSSVKAINFGIIYGMSAFTLSKDLNISVAEANGFIDSYFIHYPKVKAYLSNAVKSASDTGLSRTLFGRIRKMPELQSTNHMVRAFGERVALNMPIQGTAADIIKIAMTKVYERINRESLKSKLILQVHDELIIEAPVEEADYVCRLLKEEMEKAVDLSVPLIAEVNTGHSWAEAH